MEGGKTRQLSVVDVVVPLAHLGGNEGIDTHLALGLTAVGGKPSDIVKLIHDIEKVVSLGVERHA